MLWRKRESSEAELWHEQFKARVEQQRAAAVPSDVMIERILTVHYRQMLSNPQHRRQVKRMIEEVENNVAKQGAVRRRRP